MTKYWRIPILCAVMVVAGFLAGLPAASAQDSGPTVTGDVCMQQIFSGGGPVPNSVKLNCTANDVRISRAISVSPSSCVLDSTIPLLTGTFEIIVTSNTRYDPGFFFNIVGGTDARDNNSTCSLSVLDNASPALDLDGDGCGDLNSGTYEVTFSIPNVKCADPNGNGKLNLPNCTSWHNNADTVCEQTNPPNAPPDTKSKCVCDDEFEVGVIVTKPEGSLTKTAKEAVVTYEIVVTNDSDFAATLSALTDTLYGDITTVQGQVVETNCATGGSIAANGGTSTCQFKAKYVNPGSAGDAANTVNATLTDPNNPGNETTVSGSTTINVNLNVGP